MIIPAFDLINGNVVRLYQGNYLNQKKYDIDLYENLKLYASKGIKFIHFVDLDGARNSEKRQLAFFKDIIPKINISIQLGGGIRNENDINTLFKLGIKRVVIGSAAIINKREVKKWLTIYGSESIVLALDIRINTVNQKKEVAIHGWQENTKFILEEIIDFFLPFGLKHVLCTDISKDGTLSGPNILLYKDIVKKFKNIKFQASGGVGNLEDIVNLKKSKVDSIIIGRGLLEKQFTIEEALKC